MAEIELAGASKIDQPLVDGGHGHEDGAASFNQCRQRLFRVEFGQKNGRSPSVQGAMQGDDKAMDVEVPATAEDSSLAVFRMASGLNLSWVVTIGGHGRGGTQQILGDKGCIEGFGSRGSSTRLLRSGRSVVAFPEGQKGAAKVFRDRYRLQRFGRGVTSRSGTGLGLPLARAIARGHDGELHIHSDGPGRGARVEVWLPTPGRGLEHGGDPAGRG